MSWTRKRKCVLAGAVAAIVIVVLLWRAAFRPAPPMDAEDVTVMHIGQLAEACKDYRQQMGSWPASISQLRGGSNSLPGKTFYDGWGHEIKLVIHTNLPNSVSIESYGADGRIGGLGSNADTFMQLVP